MSVASSFHGTGLQFFRMRRLPLVLAPALIPRAAFSTTFPVATRKKNKGEQPDVRIKILRYHLFHNKTPRPLRLSRLRTLRHWTIHRAWCLYEMKVRMQQERDLERQYNAMREACEELRTGVGDGGRLFRIAMSKKGVWQGIPMEYARLQTDTPSRNGWNDKWTR